VFLLAATLVAIEQITTVDTGIVDVYVMQATSRSSDKIEAAAGSVTRHGPVLEDPTRPGQAARHLLPGRDVLRPL